MNIVDEDIVLGVLVSLFAVIPECAGVGYQLAALFEEHIIESNDTTFVKLGVIEFCCNQSRRALFIAS